MNDDLDFLERVVESEREKKKATNQFWDRYYKNKKKQEQSRIEAEKRLEELLGYSNPKKDDEEDAKSP